MNKLSKIINELGQDELMLIKKELDDGNLARIVTQKIRELREANLNKVCPVCQSPTDEDSITLIFGPRGLKKKASFCAVDCLEYFLKRQQNNNFGGTDYEQRTEEEP